MLVQVTWRNNLYICNIHINKYIGLVNSTNIYGRTPLGELLATGLERLMLVICLLFNFLALPILE